MKLLNPLRCKCVSIIFCIVALLFLLSACSDIDSAKSEDLHEVTDSSHVLEPVLPQLHTYSDEKGKYIAVLLGYGYNEGLAKDNLLAALDKEYGLVENGGIIIPLLYPDDFTSFGYERISLLPEIIEERLSEILTGTSDGVVPTLAALITLGAPEWTHRALAVLEDAKMRDAVFSVFSQDDVLGTEAGSDLVIDYRPPQNETMNPLDSAEETNLSFPGDVFEIIAPLINAAFDWKKIQEGGMFIPALRTEFLKRTSCNLFVYVDPQTGLRSKNHYVLESTVTEAQ